MAVLTDYRHFDGRHPETGSVHNVLAHQGVLAPHTGQPYSEAFLLGVSGGITFGYFTFDYTGYDPILALLTRSTFDPLETMLARLGMVQTVERTANPASAERSLVNALENGRPALVWADSFLLSYNALPPDERNWDMQPLVVYGVEDGQAYLADRAGVGLQVPLEALTAARGRVKKEKYRLVVLDPPNERKLHAAVQQGIWQCIRLYTEKPPKGGRDSFGFAALRKWSEMLVNRRSPHGWERLYPPGARLFAALAGSPYLPGAYGWIEHWGTAPGADRGTYADFLDEAARLLDRPGLGDAALLFRECEPLWRGLAAALLPDEAPLLGEARRLKDRRRRLFIEHGAAAEIGEINRRLAALRDAAVDNFPFDSEQAARFRQALSERVTGILAHEQRAVEAVQAAMEPGESRR